MILFIFLFLFGDLCLQTFKEFPSIFIIVNLLITTITAILFLKFIKKPRLIIIPLAFAGGFLWTTWYAYSIASWTLNKEWEGKPLLINGYIASLPSAGKYGTSFEFRMREIHYLNLTNYPNSIIRLTLPQKSRLPIYPAASQLKVGDKWQLLVRLKRIHGTQSPGAFDYEAWAFQKGIRASGAVLVSQDNKLISHDVYTLPIAKLRQLIQDKILFYSKSLQLSPWLMALIIGERNGISQEDWRVLRNTGTNHLMVIGGLHIGILASFAHYIVAWIWRRFPLLVFTLPATHAGACAALLMAILYSALSGFLIPTQRASIMLAVFIITLLSNRKINTWNAWCLALFCVLIINPLSVLSESFWLSFATIALIIYGMSNRLFPSGIWWKWMRVQWVIGIGLIPLTLTLFQECSVVSFIANSIAIPWLAIAILPFCILSAVFLLLYPPLGKICLLIANTSLNAMWAFLSWISHFQFSSWHIAIPNFIMLLAIIIGFLLLLLPSGVPGRWLGIIWIMPILLYQPRTPPLGEYWLSLLDVGQGLATVIQTNQHTLIYDAGPKYDAAMDMGESVVLPFLRKHKINNLNMLVVSHGDNDHIGGAEAILNVFPKTKVKTSVPEKFPLSEVSMCKAGESWQWDQVKFSFLYPVETFLGLGNDSSCVLLVDNGRHRVLLTGDIEKTAEKYLLANTRDQLHANIIIAPHHGSKTSGLKEFIEAVHPQIILYATGYRNRYHFPHQSVVQAYEEIHAQAFNTVDSGSISFVIPKTSPIQSPERYRITQKKYWFDNL